MNKLIIKLKEEITIAKQGGVPKSLISAGERVLRNLASGKAGQEEYALAVSAIKMQMSGGIIDDTETLLKFAKCLKPKEYITYIKVNYSTDKYGKKCGAISSNSSPVGRAFKDVKLEKEILAPVGTAGYTIITENGFAPFTKDVLSVKFASKEELETATDKGIYVIYANRNTCAFAHNSTLDMWENLVNGKSYTIDELTAYAAKVNGELRLYKCFIFSPSDVRQFSITALDVTQGDRRDEFLDKGSNYAWSMEKDKVEKMKLDGVSEEEIQLYILKTMPRFGQLKAGSVNLGVITSWAYYKQPFMTFSGETIDGTGYLDAVYVAECFTNILGITVTAKAVTGMFVQARPDMQKGAYLVLSSFAFKVMLKSLGKTGEVEIIGSEKDIKEPVMIVDKNVVKLESRYDLNDVCFELLEIADKSSANYSIQMHEKAMDANLEAAQDLLWDLGSKHVMSNFNSILNAKESIPTVGEIRKGYVSNIVSAIDPDRILNTPAIMSSLMKNSIQSSINSINKCKFKVDGSNAKLVADPSELIVGAGRENSIVKYGEVWMPHAEKFFKSKYRKEAIELYKGTFSIKKELILAINDYVSDKMKSTRVCMIKYPSMGVREYYLARPLTRKEIVGRINKLNASNEEKDALRDIFLSISEGVTMLPALKVVMFQCAGLDYDYDGATFVYDQTYCSILKEVAPEATCME